MSSVARQQLEKWLKTLDIKADKVIDIGGSQLPIKDRTKSWNVKEYLILDLTQPHECKQTPDFVCDLNFDYTNCLNEHNADMAFCLEVMEYIFNPVQALKNINCVLKNAGILYISFPFIYPIHPPHGKDYLRYTIHGATKLLDETGFSIEHVTHRRPEHDGNLADFWFKEKFKFDRAEDLHELLTDTGWVFKAKKIK